MYKVKEEVYNCPVEALSNILGKKWVAEIIWNIQDKRIRFGELQRILDGCSKKMLTQQLDLLIENNIISTEDKEKYSINNIKNGNLLQVLNDLNAFSTAATIVLCLIYLPLTKIV